MHASRAQVAIDWSAYAEPNKLIWMHTVCANILAVLAIAMDCEIEMSAATQMARI